MVNNNAIKELVITAKEKLNYVSPTPLLDAELLIAHTLNKPRSYIYTYPDQELSAAEQKHFLTLINQRQQGKPIAYIIGTKEFWSLEFIVNPNVLIPRPETELLVELVLHKFPANTAIKLADLGTGSGAIALAIAHERPNWEIYAVDNNNLALETAKKNAANLKIENVNFLLSDWCQNLPASDFDVITSNPPYINKNDPFLDHSCAFEPQSALISLDHGLNDLKTIIIQAKSKLKPNGILLLEHGFKQAESVQQLMLQYGYTAIVTHNDLNNNGRVTLGMIK